MSFTFGNSASDSSDTPIVPVLRVRIDGQWKAVPMLRGEKGEPFKYEDFTSEQLEGLRGEDGRNGHDGAKGRLVFANPSVLSGVVVVRDQSVNYWTASSSSETLSFLDDDSDSIPDPCYARDFVLSITIPPAATSASWGTYSIVVPNSWTVKSFVANPLSVSAVPGAVHVFGFTEIQPNVFMVTRKGLL